MKGKIACGQGDYFIEGTAHVSKNLDVDVDHLNNRILACIRTDFGDVSKLKKSKAIITEYGGLLSHAAILSREFNIPCIVGISNLTKELKEGDKLKINMSTGEVFKSKK